MIRFAFWFCSIAVWVPVGLAFLATDVRTLAIHVTCVFVLSVCALVNALIHHQSTGRWPWQRGGDE